jgi:ABC-2 type transport system permease protein
MARSVAAELLVLGRRPSTWILLATWVALALVFGYGLPYLAFATNAPSWVPGPPAELLPEGLVGTILGGFPFFGGAFALMLGVLAAGSDYDWGTWKTLLTQGPSRLHLFAAKLVAMAITLTPFVVLAFVAGAVASWIVAWREGAAVVWPDAWILARALLAAGLMLAAWAAVGVLLAVLSRGTALAIGIGVLYALAVEGLLGALLNQSDTLRPLTEGALRVNAYSLAAALGTAPAAMADNGPGAFAGPFVTWEQATLVLVAYLGGALGLAAALLVHRDVT